MTILGDATLANALRATGPADGGHTGSCVVIDCGDDLETVRTLDDLLRSGQDGTAIFAQIADPALRALVDRNLDREVRTNRPRLFCAAELAARRLVVTERFHDVALWRGQERLHAAIVGWGRLGRACLEALIPSGFAGKLGKPRVTLLVEDPDAVRRTIAQEWPELALSADIVVLDPGPASRATDVAVRLAEAHGEVPLTAVILSRPYLESLAIAAQVEAGWTASAAWLAGLHIVTDQPLPELATVRGSAADLARRVTTSDPLQGDLALDLQGEDALPRRLHAAYAAHVSGPASRPWEALPEIFRTANRAAAAHLPLKLRTIGLEPGTNPDPAAVEPHAWQAITDQLITPAGEDAVIRRLARLEHERWCAERRFRGWRYAPVRDDARRRHPDLVPFDDPRLGAAEIAKDVAQIRFLLRSVLRPSENGWAFPLVFGLCRGLPTVLAITLDDACALVRREPWRPVTVLCGLQDDTEVGSVRDLVACCADTGGRCRLIVPEFGSMLPCGGAAELLALPSTVVAPLSLVAATAEPGWVDPGLGAEAEGAYRAYIAARATALVACSTL